MRGLTVLQQLKRIPNDGAGAVVATRIEQTLNEILVEP